MLRLSSLAAIAALSACSPSQPPETPAPPTSTAEPAAAAPTPEPAPTTTAMPGAVVKSDAPSTEVYELTPSDCDALGRQFGVVQRADQMAALSPKLTAKQRAATAEQIDRVVGKLEESWTQSCQSSLVNKGVEHESITCALAAKTVRQFDVCLNGEAGTPQTPAKKKKK
jgi:hypothetical protein